MHLEKKMMMLCAFMLLFSVMLKAQSIYTAASIVDITPDLPIATDGLHTLRIVKQIETPLEADILVLESRSGAGSKENVVFVTCDLVTIPTELRDLIRDKVRRHRPDFDSKKIIVNATHTHSAPVVRKDWYKVPEGVNTSEDYLQLISERIASAIVKTWDIRAPGSVTWGTMQAKKVAFNRRVLYADGTAKMWGKANTEDYRGIEGYEDQEVGTLFVWDKAGKLAAACVNVACPAQASGASEKMITADYPHYLRESLRNQFGKGLSVLTWIGAGGDMTAMPLSAGRPAEERMFRLQGLDYGNAAGVDYQRMIGSRIADAVKETYEIVKNDRREQVVFAHETASFDLPMRAVTADEYQEAKKGRDEVLNDPAQSVSLYRRAVWHQEVIDRYEQQQLKWDTDIHVVRIGDIVICTNPFELFTDYGLQMKGRSKALQTFVVELVGPGTYVPSERAIHGGGYSAIVQSNRVGPEGGQVLVDRTVSLINKLWQD